MFFGKLTRFIGCCLLARGLYPRAGARYMCKKHFTSPTGDKVALSPCGDALYVQETFYQWNHFIAGRATLEIGHLCRITPYWQP